MKLLRYQALMTAFLMATALGLSACGGAANVVIPDSLRAPCVSTVNVEGAQTIGDLARQLQGLRAGQFNGNLRERANRNAPRLSAHLLVEKKVFLAGLPHRKGQALTVDVVEVLSFPV